MLGIRIDAALIHSYSDKDCVAGNFKGGYGFHPLAAWCELPSRTKELKFTKISVLETLSVGTERGTYLPLRSNRMITLERPF